MIESREIRVYERVTERGEVVWRENHEFRTEEQVSGADSLITACINVMANAFHRVARDPRQVEVEALKVTASYWIEMPGGGSAGAQIEVFKEIEKP